MTKESLNIINYFFNTAERYPDHTALIHQSQTVSFRQLAIEVKQTATYFRHKGISKGDRILVFVPMGIDLYRIMLALFSIGATAVFLDQWSDRKRLAQCCKLADCKGFIGIRKAVIFSWFIKELRQIPVKLKIRGQIVSSNFESATCSGEDTALITFTTGSTGIPKAANRTHGFLTEQFRVLKAHIKPEPNDVDMPALPIFIFINLAVGGTSVIADLPFSLPEKMKPEKLMQQMKKHQVTRFTASPFIVLKFASWLIKNEIRLSYLKQVFTGGAPVFPNDARIIAKAFKPAETTILYGSTEAEPISSISAHLLASTAIDAFENGLAAGYPDSEIDLKIIPINQNPVPPTDSEHLVTCKEGTVGEIIVSGPHVLTQYFNNADAFIKNKIIVGEKIYHRTGDSGYLNKSGQLFLAGRCSSVINKNGKVYYPFLYENYFNSLEGIQMGTVIPKDDKVYAVLELKTTANREWIKAAIHEMHVPPDDIIFQKIPRDPRHHSKIDYDKLISKIIK